MKNGSQFPLKLIFVYRDELFAFSALWIILFHIYGNVGLLGDGIFFVIIRKILSIGNMGVDIFLLYSAIGLCNSIRKNTLYEYYKHRMNRVIIPYLLLAVLFFSWYDFIILKTGVSRWLLDVTTIRYWLVGGDYPLWYVSFILIAYILFPVLYWLDIETDHKGIFVLIVIGILGEFMMVKCNYVIYANCERALSRIPVFLTGIIIGNSDNDHTYKIQSLISMVITGICLTALIAKYHLHIVLVRYLYGVISFCIIISYSWMRSSFCNFAKLEIVKGIGRISFEIYVIHIFLLRIINVLTDWRVINNLCWYIIIPGFTIMLAFLYSKIVNTIFWR